MLSFKHNNQIFSLEGKTLTITQLDQSDETNGIHSAELPGEIVGDITYAFYDYISRTTQYKIEPDDDHYTIGHFKEMCDSGAVIDSDGTGYYATETYRTGYVASPASIHQGVIDNRFTHVVWFNK